VARPIRTTKADEKTLQDEAFSIERREGSKRKKREGEHN